MAQKKKTPARRPVPGTFGALIGEQNYPSDETPLEGDQEAEQAKPRRRKQARIPQRLADFAGTGN